MEKFSLSPFKLFFCQLFWIFGSLMPFNLLSTLHVPHFGPIPLCCFFPVIMSLLNNVGLCRMLSIGCSELSSVSNWQLAVWPRKGLQIIVLQVGGCAECSTEVQTGRITSCWTFPWLLVNSLEEKILCSVDALQCCNDATECCRI